MDDFITEQKLQNKFHQLSESDRLKIISKLPDKKFYEFLYHSWFNNQLENVAENYKTWQPWQEWHYPIDDLIRFTKVILDNKSFIESQNIFDIGSHLGYITLFCLHLGCKHITGLEPRENKHELSSFVCKTAGYQNFKFVKGSTYQDNFMTCADKVDTVILSALIYHVADHFRLLKKITDSSAKCLIIENKEKKHIAFDIEPKVAWKIEDIDQGKDTGGWHPNKNQFLVGTPNQPFLNGIMFELGWRLAKNEYFYVNTHLENKRLMSTSIYVR